MKILIDFFPILLFFGAYKLYDIYIGTGVLMAATIAQVALIYAIDKRLQTMHKITLVLVLGFGFCFKKIYKRENETVNGRHNHIYNREI